MTHHYGLVPGDAMALKEHVNMFTDVEVRYAEMPDIPVELKLDAEALLNSICQACRKKLEDPECAQRIQLPKYFCGYCHRKLQHRHSLWVHLIHHTASMKRPPFTCPLCQKVFDTLSGYKLHLGSLHSVKPSHDCPHCPEKFIDKKMFESHMVLHRPASPQEIRSREFVTHLLEFHQSIVCQDCTSRLQHVCMSCREMFNRKEELRHHVLDVHFHCPMCPLTFVKKSELFVHMKQFHENVMLENCSVCPLPMDDVEDATVHIPDAQQILDATTTVKEETDCDGQPKPIYQCAACKTYFLTDDSKEEVAEEHLCMHCKHQGPEQQRKRRRITSGSSECSEYRCDECDIQFKNIEEIQQHALNHKSMKEEPKVVDVENSIPALALTKLKCNICRGVFLTIEQLRHHNEVTHHFCHVCNVAFHEKSHLILHFITSHQDKNPVICEACKQLYVTVYQTDPTEALKQVDGLPFIFQPNAVEPENVDLQSLV